MKTLFTKTWATPFHSRGCGSPCPLVAGRIRSLGLILAWAIMGGTASLQAGGHDFFSERTLLAGGTTSDLGDFTGASQESDEPVLPVTTRGQSLWWTWVAPAAGEVAVDLFGFTADFQSDLDTVLAVFTGDSLATLELVDFNDDDDGPFSRCMFTALPGVAYHFLADLHADEAATGSAFLSVTLEESNGEPPTNNDFAAASVLEGATATAESTFRHATAEQGEPLLEGGRKKTLWWRWTAPADGTAIVNLAGVNGGLDTLLNIYFGSRLDALELLMFDDDSGPGSSSEAGFRATAGITYYFQGDLFDTGGGPTPAEAVRIDLELLVLPPVELRPANDDFARAIPLSGLSGSSEAGNEYATGENGEPAGNGGLRARSVWWKWTAPKDGYLRVDTMGSTTAAGAPMDTVLVAYRGNTLNDLEEVEWNDDRGSLLTSEVTLSVDGGGIYYLAVIPSDNSPRGMVRLSYQAMDSIPGPTWTALGLDRSEVRSSDFAGSVQLVNLWATWCGPCIAEIPDLISLHEQYASQGLVVLGVSVDSPVDGTWPHQLVNDFVAEHQMTYPVVMDRPSGTIESGYGGADAIPTTFLVNRAGQVVRKLVGTRTFSQFEQVILPLLNAAPPAPALQAQRLDSGRIELSWATQAGLSLEFRSTLSGTWQPVAATPVTRDGRQVVEISAPHASRFYRLTSP